MGVARLLVANRGEIAAESSAPATGSGSRRSPSRPPTTRAFHTRATARTVAVATYLDPDEIVRAARESGRTGAPRLRLPCRECCTRRSRRGGGTHLGGAATRRRCAWEATRWQRSASQRRPVCRCCCRASRRRSASRFWSRRLPAAACRHAHCPFSGRARGRHFCRPTRGRVGLRRPLRLLRALPRAGPPCRYRCSPMGSSSSPSESATARSGRHRLLEEAPAPRLGDDVRGRLPRGRRRVRAGDWLPKRRDGGVPRRRRVLLPRAERANPGRAPGDRGGHRPRRSSCNCGSPQASR